MAIERTLIQIRERPMLDLLDLGLVVIRKRPLALGIAAVAGVAPFFALNLWIFSRCAERAVGFFASTLWMVEAPFATAPLTLVLGGLMFGQKPSFRKAFGSLARGTFGLVVVHGLIRPFCFFWIPTRLAFANAILLLERGKWWKLLGRGADLANGRGAELYLLSMTQLFLSFVFSMICMMGLSRVVQIFLAEDLSFEPPADLDLSSWMIQIPLWTVVQFFAVVRFLIYIDQRIRLEGWEVELRLREVGESIAEARRW